LITPEEQLQAAVERLLAVGRAEGIEVGGPLGAWLEAQAQALLGLASVLRGQGVRVDDLLGRIEHAASLQIEALREASQGANDVVRQGEIALRQARQAQHGVVVEREHLVQKMVKDTLPLFATQLKGALVIQAKTWNGKARDQRYAMMAGITLAVFLFGYCTSWWQDSGRVSAFERCLTHPVQADGQVYCQANGLFAVPKPVSGSGGN
jgi:hypothetical protein